MRKGFREIGIVPAETPVIASVAPNSAAAKAGLQPKDVITGINGQQTYNVLAVADYIRTHSSEPLKLDVRRDGKQIALPIEPESPTIGRVLEGSPAARAHLEKGDVIAAIDGQPVRSAVVVSNYVKAHPGQPITMSILRKGQPIDAKVTAEIPQYEKTPLIGVQWQEWEENFGIALDDYVSMALKHPRPVEQIRAGMMSIFNTVGAVASSKSDVKLQHMSGPVMMMQVYYRMFESKEGWRMALWFSVVLNVNLALLNLLPIPVLDGGHIMLAIIEAVRRRPVNMRVLEVVQTACAVLIIGFMVYIAFFDVQDLFGGRRDSPRFSPKASAPAKSNPVTAQPRE
jgi:regulator of sigma E protease